MAYMDEMALEREKSRQAMLAGKQPLLGADTASALHQLGINLGIVPPGTPPSQTSQLLQSLISKGPGRVKVDEARPLQVQPLVGRLTASLQQAAPSDDSVGANISAGFGAAKDSALQQMLRDQQRAQQREQQQRQQPPGTPAAPGAPAPNANLRAAAYRGRVPHSPEGPTYKADLDYLTSRGGHFSVLKDGKITNVPVGTPGQYGNLDPELAARLRAAGEAFEKENPGKKAQFGEFSRGADVQKIYHDKYKAGGGIAAAPGQSRHQHGAAGDLPTSEFRDWLYKGNQDKFGVHFPVKGDAPHVEVNPRYKGPSYSNPTGAPAAAAPANPAAPAAPAAAPATPPAAAPKPAAAVEPLGVEKVLAHAPALAPAPSAQPAAQPAAGGNTLAEQRAPYRAQMQANPTVRDSLAAIMLTESSTDMGQQGVAEAAMNRATAKGLPNLSAALGADYHDQMRGNAAKYNAAFQKIQADPELRARMYALQDKALGGSDVSKLATDYGSAGVAERANRTATVTARSDDGQHFYRKDTNPTEHGAGNVAKIKDWHQKTTAAQAQSPAAPQAAPQASPQTPPQAPPQATAAPSAPAAAAPAAAPPTAAAPVSPAAAPAAAKPAPQVNPAHALLDTKVIDLVKKGDPSKVSQVPGFLADKTLREAMNMPIVGGQVAEGVKPFLGRMGVTQQQFDSAVKEGPPKPGKRSEAPVSEQKVRYAAADTGTMSDASPELPADPNAPTLDPLQQKPVQNEDGSISTVRTIGIEDNGKEVNIPTVPAEGGRVMSNEEAVQRYDATGKHLGKFDTAEEAGAAAEKLHQEEAARVSQQPKGEQPAMTPELAKALMDSVKDESRVPPSAPTPPADALPVLPAQPAGPEPNTGAGGLSLAPSGLSSIPTGALQPGAAPSQGGSIAMAGVLPPIQNATFSTPLLDQTAARGSAMSLSPIPFQTLGGWGWGGNIGSGFDWGGGGGSFSSPMFGGFSGD